jgi:shikimate dehydrogenase
MNIKLAENMKSLRAERGLSQKELAPFLRAREFEGLNVTIPYKSAVIPYLDELDEAAEKIGSVNTVENRGGRLIGHNTDYAGFLWMAYRAGITFAGRKVLILGSGGTSLTAQAVARDAGAREIVVLSRSGENDYSTLSRHYDSEVIVNATPVGMYPRNGETLLDLSRFSHPRGVIDVIYNPLRTPLVDRAERLGIPSTHGLYMLVAQAAIAAKFFTGTPISEEEIGRITLGLMREKQNIVLVGMPGCGKSTVAAELAEKTGRRVLDTDAMVEEMTGRHASEIIETDGEGVFRRYESEALMRAGRESGVIISTGGGAVLDAKNRYPLAQNGKIYFLLRELERLSREGRPLSLGTDLRQMYRKRLPRYLSFADLTLENNGAPSDCADAILEDFYAHPDIKRTKP